LTERSRRSSGVQEFRSSGVQEFRSSGVQEFRSSGVQEFRSSGVQEFRSSGVQAVEEQKIARRKCALPFGMTVAHRGRSGAPELPNSWTPELL
jgi:hypothetical protein